MTKPNQKIFILSGDKRKHISYQNLVSCLAWQYFNASGGIAHIFHVECYPGIQCNRLVENNPQYFQETLIINKSNSIWNQKWANLLNMCACIYFLTQKHPMHISN